MLTIAEILKSTPPSVKEKVSDVVTKTKKAISHEGSSLFTFTTATKKVSGKKQEKYESIVLLTSVPKTKAALAKSEAWVSCSCPFFKFSCEKALADKGSSSIIHTKDYKPPAVPKKAPVNPRNIPQACKHLLSCFVAIPKQTIKEGKMPLKNEIQKALTDIKQYLP